MGFNCVDEEPKFDDLDIINHQVMTMDRKIWKACDFCFMFDDFRSD